MGRYIGRNRQKPPPIAIIIFMACITLYILGSSIINLPTSIYLPDNLKETFSSNIPRQQYAVANFVDNGHQYLYGAYSIHQQLVKYNMTRRCINATNHDYGRSIGDITHIAVVSNSLSKEYHHVLNTWLGEENIRVIDNGYILDQLTPAQKMWKGTFNKLSFFNLTEFDKVITLDTDVLVRSNIMHWFDYDTPCAIQAKDDLNWNSGAMVIHPDTYAFEEMVRTLPKIQRYGSNQVYEHDPLTNGYGDQDFISAFFLNNSTTATKRCIMPTESAVLVSSLDGNQWFDYYNKYRPWVYQTVHFTTLKPWRDGVQSRNPFLCLLLREWKESIAGIEEYYDLIPPLKNYYLAKCPNTSVTA